MASRLLGTPPEHDLDVPVGSKYIGVAMIPTYPPHVTDSAPRALHRRRGNRRQELDALPGRFTFAVTPHNAEEVPRRIGENHPSRPIRIAPISHRCGPQTDNPFDFLVSGSIDGRQIEVDTALGLLQIGHPR